MGYLNSDVEFQCQGNYICVHGLVIAPKEEPVCLAKLRMDGTI